MKIATGLLLVGLALFLGSLAVCLQLPELPDPSGGWEAYQEYDRIAKLTYTYVLSGFLGLAIMVAGLITCPRRPKRRGDGE